MADAILLELQKKVYGQRADKLTPIETNRLFDLPVNPEFILSLYQGLKREALDPDVAILQAIPRAVHKDYVLPIAMCIRMGANTNMYVNAPKIGSNIHLLGYVYHILNGVADTDVINAIIVMLVANGARPSLPMFDRNAGKLSSDERPKETSLTIAEWLDDQGYDTILDRVSIGEVSELRKVIDKESLTSLSIMLDMPTLAGRDYESRDLHDAIRVHSIICFDAIPTPSTKVLMDFKSLDDSVKYLNSRAFDKLITRGQMPSYILMNKIIVDMRTYHTQNRMMPMQELEAMLLSAIAVGVALDRDEYAIVSTLGKNILDAVSKEYNQPYWRKICKAPSEAPAPEQLRRLAISLNIDPTMSRKAMCENISTLSKADKEALKEAAHRRQQIRMAGDIGYMNEFTNGRTPVLVCRNQSVLPHMPEDYIDIDLAYYRDDQGAVWCFPSDNFSTLLESGINPYNSTALPQSFKDQLKYQIEVLQRLGIAASSGAVGIYESHTPLTFSTAIDSLTAKDVVNERESAQALAVLTELAVRNGISSETIRKLTKPMMMNALRSININIDLNSLSTSHALVTTARIIQYINSTSTSEIPSFFNSLNLGTL